MYGFFDDVTADSVMSAEIYRGQFDIGDNLAVIDQVEFKKSQRGNTMMVVTLKKLGGETLRHYIVDNEYKLGNLKMFYQCFNIPAGNVEYENWKGRSGVVVTKLGEASAKGVRYPKVDYMRPRDAGGKLPPVTHAEPWESNAETESDTSQENVSSGGQVCSHFDDDIPF